VATRFKDGKREHAFLVPDDYRSPNEKKRAAPKRAKRAPRSIG
jgi:hypothetical protein